MKEIIESLLPIILFGIGSLIFLAGWMAVLIWRDLREEEKGDPAKDGAGMGEEGRDE